MILPALRGYYGAIAGYTCGPDATVSCPIYAFVGTDDGLAPYDNVVRVVSAHHIGLRRAGVSRRPLLFRRPPSRRRAATSSPDSVESSRNPQARTTSLNTTATSLPATDSAPANAIAVDRDGGPVSWRQHGFGVLGQSAPRGGVDRDSVRRGVGRGGHRRRGARQPGLRPPCADLGRRRRIRRRLLRLHPAGRPDDRSAAPAVPAVRLARVGGCGLRPRPVRRLDRRVRKQLRQRLSRLQPAVAPEPEHHHGPGREHRSDQPVLPERQGFPRDTGIASVQPARVPASPSRPRARPRWWRCTWPARAC